MIRWGAELLMWHELLQYITYALMAIYTLMIVYTFGIDLSTHLPHHDLHTGEP